MEKIPCENIRIYVTTARNETHELQIGDQNIAAKIDFADSSLVKNKE